MSIDALRPDILLAVAATMACEAELLADGHPSPRRVAAAALLAAGGAAVVGGDAPRSAPPASRWC